MLLYTCILQPGAGDKIHQVTLIIYAHKLLDNFLNFPFSHYYQLYGLTFLDQFFSRKYILNHFYIAIWFFICAVV